MTRLKSVPKGWQTQSKPVARSAPRQSKVKVPSAGEAVLCRHLDALKIDYEQEFKFHTVRKWRADFLITGYPILVECEGGIWNGLNGGHTSGKGYTANCENTVWLQLWGILLSALRLSRLRKVSV